MELETFMYLLIILFVIYYFILCSCSEKFDTTDSTYENKRQRTQECSRNDINNQFYDYNVNTINRKNRID